MAFVNAKTGKQIKLSTGYLSNPIDYQTFVKRQEEKRRSAAASPAAAPKTGTTAPKAKRDIAAAPRYRAEGLPSKAKGDAATAPRIRAEGLPSARPSAVSLQNQLRQAQADLDTDAVTRLNRQLKEERARHPSAGGYSLGQGITDIFKKGANQVAQTGADTLALAEDIIHAPFELFSGMELGSLRNSGQGIFNPLGEKVRGEGAVLAEKSAENVRKGGTGAALLDKYGTATVAAVPQSIIAMLTGGTSAAAQAAAQTTGGVARAAAAEMSPGIARTIQNVAGGLARDPQFWSSFSQTVGSGYKQALEDGASAPKAVLYAVGNGLMNAAVEVGGGIQTLPGELRAGASGWRAFVDSALDEGREEVIQGVIERAMQNLIYQKGNPLASVKNPDAVFNPLTAAEEFAGGAVVGGILSGGQIAANRALSGVDAHVRGTLEMMNRAAGRGTVQEAAQEAPGVRLEAGRGTDTPGIQGGAVEAQVTPENIFLKTAAAVKEEVDRQVRDTLELMQRAAGMETGTAQQETAPGMGAAVNENGLTALSQLERENLSSGKRNKVVSTFNEAVNFVRNALRNRQSTERAYLGKIPDSTARRVLDETGVNISGYNAILHSDNIRHIIKNHGDPLMEPLRGQVPLTAEHIAMIPEVLSTPDRVYLSPETDSRGRKILVFEKNIDGNYITMQAVSDGTHSIQTDTIYVRKEKNPQGTESYDAGMSTGPAHNARSVPPQGSSDIRIPQGTETVNPTGTDGLGAADAGFTTRGMEGQERTSRMAETHPYNKTQEAASAMTREEYDRLFRYRSQTEAKTTHLAEELVYVLQDGKKTFLKDANEAAYDALKESLQEATAWNAEQAEAAKMIELELLGRSYNGGITSEEYTDWLKTIREHGTSTGQGIQAFAKWSRSDNNRGQATASQAVETIQSSKLSDAQKQARVREVLDFTNRINDVQEGDTHQLEDIILEISKKRGTTTGFVAKRLDGALRKAMDSLTFQELKQFAFSSTEALSTDAKPLNPGEAAKTIQVLNMLSSFKTPGRNLTGNTAFYGLDALSMDGAALLDMALSNVTGTRSVAMGGSPVNRAMWENAMKSAKMSTLEAALDVDMGSGETMYGTGGQRTFRAGAQHEGKGGKALNFTERVLSALERNNSFLLTVPDEFFKGMARGNEANIQRLIDQGKIKTDNANYAAEQADALAKYRTFQDTNAASAISSGIHDLLNLIGTGDSGKKIKGLTVHSFGLGDFVSPFSRVAANLAARGVDYNPVTAVRGVVEMGTILYDAKRGKTIDPARQAKAVSRTARGLSGTAVIGGFLALLSGGLIRRADDEGDENVAALNRSEGRTGYQFNLSAAKRWMDGESQKWQNGDKLLDISSLQPFNELLGVADQIYHDEQKTPKSLLIDDVLGMMYAAADIPVLQTAGDLAKDLTLYKKDPVEAFSEAAVNTAVSSVTPNILRSVAQGIDDRPRSINREEGLWRLIQDEFKSRVPGLRQTLPGGVDPTGADKTYPGSRLGNFLNSTVNPMGLNTYEQTEQSQEWQRLREGTGRTDFYPSSRIPKKLEGKGLGKDLSYEERQDFQRDRGIWLILTVSEMMGNRGYQTSGIERQSDLMADARDFAHEAAKRAVLGPDSVSKWVNGALEAQQKTGLSPSAVIYYKDMLSREEKQTVRNAIRNDSSLNAAQKNALDDLVISDVIVIPDKKDVDYSSDDSFVISQMSESAMERWPLVQEGMPGITGEQYQTAWDIAHRKGTKEEPYTQKQKKQDLREELDLTDQEVKRIWDLMVKAAER